MLRIWYVYPGSWDPGSEFFHPDPGSWICIKVFKYFQPQKLFLTLGNMIRDVHPGSRGQKGTESRTDPQHCLLAYYLTKKKENYFKVGFNHSTPTPYPLPLHVAKTGRNHLNEEITPILPTGIGARFSQTISNLGHAAILSRCELPQ
jgi:hypothetical protein